MTAETGVQVVFPPYSDIAKLVEFLTETEARILVQVQCSDSCQRHFEPVNGEKLPSYVQENNELVLNLEQDYVIRNLSELVTHYNAYVRRESYQIV